MQIELVRQIEESDDRTRIELFQLGGSSFYDASHGLPNQNRLPNKTMWTYTSEYAISLHLLYVHLGPL